MLTKCYPKEKIVLEKIHLIHMVLTFINSLKPT